MHADRKKYNKAQAPGDRAIFNSWPKRSIAACRMPT